MLAGGPSGVASVGNLRVPHQVTELRSREDVLAKSMGRSSPITVAKTTPTKRRPVSATSSRISPMERPKGAVSPTSGVSRSSLGNGFRQPPLYHLQSYPERLPRARSELTKLGATLDGLLAERRISADDLKLMEDSAMVVGSFSKERLLPDSFTDPNDVAEADNAFDVIVTELVRQALVKVNRLAAIYRERTAALEAGQRDRKKKLDKYKTLAMLADDHEKHFVDELAAEPYPTFPIPMLKKRLFDTEVNNRGLLKALKDKEEELRNNQMRYTNLLHTNETNRKELEQLRAEKAQLVPKRFMDIVTEQCDSYVSENSEMRAALINYDVMKAILDDKKRDLHYAVAEKVELEAQVQLEKLRVEEIKTSFRVEASLLRWRLATALMRPKAEKSKYSEESKAVLPYISLNIPQPILITNAWKGVKAIDKDQTITHCCKLLQAKVAADAADLKRGDEREAAPSYMEEYFQKQTKGNSREASKLFQSLVISLKQHYRHAAMQGNHKVIGLMGTLAGLIRPEAYCPHGCHLIVALLKNIFSDRPKGIASALQYNELLPASKYEEAIVGSGQRQVPQSWTLVELKSISPAPPELLEWLDGLLKRLVHVGPDGDEKIAILDFLEKVLAFATARTMVHHVELQELFKELDDDGSGHLSFEEFKTVSSKRLIGLPKSEKGLLKLFNKINSLDDDPDALVDPSVFSTVLIRKGVLPTNPVAAPLSRASVKAMMKFAAAASRAPSPTPGGTDSENENSAAAAAAASTAQG